MTQSDPAFLVEASNVSKRFGGVTAVRDVDFRLRERELRCLIGPNGAGKSTFFKLLTGQLPPSDGRILFRGKDITGLDPHRIARLGMGVKTQVPNVFDALTVRENIWLGATRRQRGRRARALVDELLTRVQLEAIADRVVGKLAHGQRQWVEIATVLAQDPVLVLLDEPVAGMSHEETLRTADLIKEIAATRSVLVVEHDMAFIRLIATTVTVFDRGAILMEDDVENVLSDARVRDVYLGEAAA